MVKNLNNKNSVCSVNPPTQLSTENGQTKHFPADYAHVRIVSTTVVYTDKKPIL